MYLFSKLISLAVISLISKFWESLGLNPWTSVYLHLLYWWYHMASQFINPAHLYMPRPFLEYQTLSTIPFSASSYMSYRRFHSSCPNFTSNLSPPKLPLPDFLSLWKATIILFVSFFGLQTLRAMLCINIPSSHILLNHQQSYCNYLQTEPPLLPHCLPLTTLSHLDNCNNL